MEQKAPSAHRLLGLHTTFKSRETCYATVIGRFTLQAGVDTHYQLGLHHRLQPRWELESRMSQARRLAGAADFDITVASAAMLLVGTQPLRSQHPPLTPLPLGSAIPRRLETNLRVERTRRCSERRGGWGERGGGYISA